MSPNKLEMVKREITQGNRIRESLRAYPQNREYGKLSKGDEQWKHKRATKGAVLLVGMKPKSFGHEELSRMIHRLARYKDSYMLFMSDYAAPFTNNQAERDLRHCKNPT